MPVSDSGRVLIEIDPELKRDLYSALDREGLTLKEWFTRHVQRYITHSIQPELSLVDPGGEVQR
jgi:hypothetical protein